MIEPIDFAREIWKEFNLNDSFGAGMTLYENGVEVKRHGKATNTDDLKEMGESIVQYRQIIEITEPKERKVKKTK